MQLNIDDDAADTYSVNATSFGPHLPCVTTTCLPPPPALLPLRHGGGDTMSSGTTPPSPCVMRMAASWQEQCHHHHQDDDAAGMNGVSVRRPAPPPSSLLDSHFHHHLCRPPSILPCITMMMQTPPAPSLLSKDNDAVDKNSACRQCACVNVVPSTRSTVAPPPLSPRPHPLLAHPLLAHPLLAHPLLAHPLLAPTLSSPPPSPLYAQARHQRVCVNVAPPPVPPSPGPHSLLPTPPSHRTHRCIVNVRVSMSRSTFAWPPALSSQPPTAPYAQGCCQHVCRRSPSPPPSASTGHVLRIGVSSTYVYMCASMWYHHHFHSPRLASASPFPLLLLQAKATPMHRCVVVDTASPTPSTLALLRCRSPPLTPPSARQGHALRIGVPSTRVCRYCQRTQ
ncbi:hypothetical protein BDQ17DRAFT_1424818 [Cyathus striatus]|nr:hypothetical protein BDQ17DRAFT_1424818 [Cyathus striatus]